MYLWVGCVDRTFTFCSCGRNTGGQSNGIIQNHTIDFSQYLLPWIESEGEKEIIDFGCSSLGNYFTTSDKKTYFSGGTVNRFKEDLKKLINGVVVHCLDWKQVLTTLSSLVRDEVLPNQILPGGWFYCFCFNHQLETGYVMRFRSALLHTLLLDNQEKNLFLDMVVHFQ